MRLRYDLIGDDDQPTFLTHETVRESTTRCLSDEHVWEEHAYGELDRWGDRRWHKAA